MREEFNTLQFSSTCFNYFHHVYVCMRVRVLEHMKLIIKLLISEFVECVDRAYGKLCNVIEWSFIEHVIKAFSFKTV